MKVGIVRSSDLTQCWSAHQLDSCYKCIHYQSCTYPQRKANPEYDALVKARREAYAVYVEMGEKLKNYDKP